MFGICNRLFSHSIMNIGRNALKFKTPIPLFNDVTKNIFHTTSNKFAWPHRSQPLRLGSYCKLAIDKINSRLDYNSNMDLNDCKCEIRLSNIICTVGPASADISMLEKMIESGMNICRLNLSHGSHEDHANTIKNIRKACENYSTKIDQYYPLAIALDTKGPEIRTGLIEGSGSAEVILKKGDEIRLSTDKAIEQIGNNTKVFIDYPNITKVVEKGMKIYVDDGFISMYVKNVGSDFLDCIIENGGVLGSRKGVNLPGIPVDLPAVSEKDKIDLKFATEQGVDMIFASFIRKAGAIKEIKDILGQDGKDIKIISKIENREGVENRQGIIDASDGIMVARGDLGIEIPPEYVNLVQKMLISLCNKAGKPVICATQMLESMVKKPRATRAEYSDVSNAILDGADSVMLSGETAKGEYPLECVQTMATICKTADAFFSQDEFFYALRSSINHVSKRISNSPAMNAVSLANDSKAKAIILILTDDYPTPAHLISKYRPLCPIIAITGNAQIARQLQMYRGIIPLLYCSEHPDDCLQFRSQKVFEERVDLAIKFGKKHDIFYGGSTVIVVSGSKIGDVTIRSFSVPKQD